MPTKHTKNTNMKRLIFFGLIGLIGLMGPIAEAADYIKVVKITFTDAPEEDDTVTVAGNVRTWKTSVSAPASQIAIGVDASASAAAYAAQILETRYIGISSTRNGLVVTLIGTINTALTASASGAWATVEVSTVNITQYPAMFPLSGESSARRVVIANDIVTAIADYASGLFPSATVALGNFLNLSGVQTVTGAKTFTGANVHNGGTATNGFELRGARIGFHTNEMTMLNTGIALGTQWVLGVDTNGVPGIAEADVGSYDDAAPAYYPATDKAMINGFIGDSRYGKLSGINHFTGTNTFDTLRSPGSGAQSEKLGTGAVASGVNAFAAGYGALAVGNNSVAIGTSAVVSNNNSIAVGNSALSTNTFTIALGRSALAGENKSIAIGESAVSQFANATAIGAGASTTDEDQIRLGDTSSSTSVPVNLSAGGNVGVGGDWVTFAADLAGGIQMVNGTAPSADPASGVVLWSEGGELFMRTSASGEGAGGKARVFQRAEEVVGSGTDFAIAGTAYARVNFSGQDPEIVLPSAGTYSIGALVQITAGGTASDAFSAMLYDSTASADIANTEQTISFLPASTMGQIHLQSVATVATGSHTIQVYVKNATAARGSVNATLTKVWFERKH